MEPIGNEAEDAQKRKVASDTLYRKALRLCKKGQLAQGIKLFSKAIKLDRGHVKSYLNRGLALERSGQLKRAVHDYTQAISLR
jgi:Tfp pilus assembly protein PilF